MSLEFKKGLNNLFRKLRVDDITYYLNKGSLNLNKEDEVLNNFRIYHFHINLNYEDDFIKEPK